jgi:hypothetical protein
MRGSTGWPAHSRLAADSSAFTGLTSPEDLTAAAAGRVQSAIAVRGEGLYEDWLGWHTQGPQLTSATDRGVMGAGAAYVRTCRPCWAADSRHAAAFSGPLGYSCSKHMQSSVVVRGC